MTMTATGEQLKPHEYSRPESIEDGSNRFFVHPLSDFVVTLSMALKLSPNFISILGLVCGIGAAFSYYNLPAQPYVVTGFLLMLGWHIFDGADGRLARATGQCSAFGRIIDGICDHLVFGAVYISLGLHLIDTGFSMWVWLLVIGAGISHALQSAAYEERRQKFQRRVKGLNRTDCQEGLMEVDGKKSALAAFYDKVQLLVAGKESGLDTALGKMQVRAHYERERMAIINKTASMVRAWGLLNANNRTILIAVMAFMGQPALYFLFEVVVLNMIMAVLLFAEQRQERRLLSEIHLKIV